MLSEEFITDTTQLLLGDAFSKSLLAKEVLAEIPNQVIFFVALKQRECVVERSDINSILFMIDR